MNPSSKTKLIRIFAVALLMLLLLVLTWAASARPASNFGDVMLQVGLLMGAIGAAVVALYFRFKRIRYHLQRLLLWLLAIILLDAWSNGPASDPTFTLPPPTVPIVFDGKVDVGGYRLYLQCVGEGSPTVVLDSGLGDNWGFWNIIPHLATHTRVCGYSRAGLGRSDPAPTSPRTNQAMVNDLHTLLSNAHIEGPYVLAGHSIAVLNLFLYVKQYPQDVVGLVLIDVGTPDTWYQFAKEVQAMPTTTPNWKQTAAWGYGDNPEGYDIVTSAIQVHDAGTELGDLPFIILVANRNASTIAEQKKMANLSSNSTLMVANTSAHIIQRAEPISVLKAILKAVEAVRKYRQ